MVGIASPVQPDPAPADQAPAGPGPPGGRDRRLLRYAARRLAAGLVVLWAAYTLSFVVLYVLPGDPIEIMTSSAGVPSATEAQIEEMREQYGLDRPLPVQYVTAGLKAVRLDLGTSIQSGRDVRELIVSALPPTLQLAGAALAIAVVAAAALAVGGTAIRRPWLSNALLSLPVLGTAMPVFWLGMVLLQLFSFRLGWFPAFGGEGLRSLVLPAVTLAVPLTAVLAQVLANSIRTEAGQPYVDTAAAKGLTAGAVHLRHVVRNALIPATALLGVLAGNALAGSVVVEIVFSRPGLGRLAQAAVLGKDIPVVQGLVMLFALVFVLTNLIVDLVLPVLDPRISSSAPGGG